MQKNSQDFSMEKIMAMAKSPAGQQLIAMLQDANRSQMEQTAQLAAAGNYDQAAKMLERTLSSEQAKALIKQLGG